jgi:serine/threonine protein kinase
MNLEIPGFELIERLGAGGMASVWKARQISLDRIVAIKILYSQFSSDPSDVDRFLSEARMTARLKHPGIVQVYDVGVHENMYYIVMEYVAGYTVGSWIERSGVLSAHDCLLTTECIADALNYAWELDQIIHCDIKPHNALIDADGTIKISDLGLARTLSILSVNDGSDDIMGTPFYMSPEQAMGEQDLDCRSDIYSLGAMLYHMSTGSMPFQGYPDEEVMDMQVTHVIPDAMDVNPEIPTPMAWLIEKMMCKQRDGRQLTWTDVVADIRHVKNGRRPPIMPPEGSSTVARSSKRIKKKTPMPSHLSPKSKKRTPAIYVLIFFALAAAAFVFAYTRGYLDSYLPVITEGRGNAKPTGSAKPMKAEWTKRIEEIEKWIGNNPEDIAGAVWKYEQLNLEMLGTPYAEPVQDRIGELSVQRGVEIDRVLKDLQALADPLLENYAFGEAADVYGSYTGRYADHTAEARAQKAEEFRQRVGERVEASVADSQDGYEAAMDAIVAHLVKGDIASARDVVKEALKNGRLGSSRADLKRVNKELQHASRTDGQIIASFYAHVDKTLEVELRSGKRRIKIISVNGSSVTGQLFRENGEPGATIKFTVGQLGFGERLRRMGEDSTPGVALAKGLMALKAGSATHAKQYFLLAEPQLSERLLESIK